MLTNQFCHSTWSSSAIVPMSISTVIGTSAMQPLQLVIIKFNGNVLNNLITCLYDDHHLHSLSSSSPPSSLVRSTMQCNLRNLSRTFPSSLSSPHFLFFSAKPFLFCSSHIFFIHSSPLYNPFGVHSFKQSPFPFSPPFLWFAKTSVLMDAFFIREGMPDQKFPKYRHCLN